VVVERFVQMKDHLVHELVDLEPVVAGAHEQIPSVGPVPDGLLELGRLVPDLDYNLYFLFFF
jgi:hypothetical protein